MTGRPSNLARSIAVDREVVSLDAVSVRTTDGESGAGEAVVLRPDLEVIQIDDEICIFDPRVDQVLTLNSTASAVWSACDGRRSTDEVAAAISSLYDADVEAVRSDVRSLIGAWHDAGLTVGE